MGRGRPGRGLCAVLARMPVEAFIFGCWFPGWGADQSRRDRETGPLFSQQACFRRRNVAPRAASPPLLTVPQLAGSLLSFPVQGRLELGTRSGQQGGFCPPAPIPPLRPRAACPAISLAWLAAGPRMTLPPGTAVGTWPTGLQSSPTHTACVGSAAGERSPRGSGPGWALGKHSGHMEGGHERRGGCRGCWVTVCRLQTCPDFTSARR